MKSAKLRLAVAAALFFAWIGWLAYLAVTTTRTKPVVLSRPQFLVSSLDVIARVDQRDGEEPQVQILKVHWPNTQRDQEKAGQTVKVTNLKDCENWTGPGLYILPLVRSGEGTYQVAPTPPSPGFAPLDARGRPKPPPIYPLTEQTEAQLDAIRKPDV